MSAVCSRVGANAWCWTSRWKSNPSKGRPFRSRPVCSSSLSASGELLHIFGSVDVNYHNECNRCLGDVDGLLHLDVDEQIDTGPEAPNDPFDAGNVLTGDRLDVKYLATQLVCSAVPLSMLCDENCKGICQDCGENKNSGACTCAVQLERR